MDVAISGATGLIGSALARSLEADGHRVVRISRRPGGSASTGRGREVHWDPAAGTIDAAGLEGLDAVVHLAGEPIASGRFTEEHKRRVWTSRTAGTQLLARTLAELSTPPGLLVSGSAIGYYGSRGDEVLTESSPPGDDFLADLCVAWEAATGPASSAGIPVAHIRTGIVLSTDGGMLGKVLLPYKLGLGGKAGRGDQWMSWIVLADVVRAIRHLIDHSVSGPVDLTAPEPVTNAEFNRALGRAVHRPTLLPIPRIATKLPLGVGPLVDSLLFSGARVLPKALDEAGFTFDHPRLDEALAALVGRRHEVA